jgi:hypothetical protein
MSLHFAPKVQRIVLLIIELDKNKETPCFRALEGYADVNGLGATSITSF